MAEQKLVTIARQMVDAFNAGDREGFKKHVATDAIYDEVGTQRQLHGAESWVRAWEEWRHALPDVKGTINNVVAAGNTVVLEIAWEGTHSGALSLPGNTIPPSGKRQITRATQVLIFEGEKVKESRHYFDLLGLLQQIGAAPRLTRAAG